MLIIRATNTEIFYGMKTAKVKPPKTSLDPMDFIMKFVDEICGEILVEYYAVYKKRISK